jgi:hypothetical protein
VFYLKATYTIPTGPSFEDYFEAGPDGRVLRLVSNVNGRWSRYAADRDDTDLHHAEQHVPIQDVAPSAFISVDEFERAWRRTWAA